MCLIAKEINPSQGNRHISEINSKNRPSSRPSAIILPVTELS